MEKKLEINFWKSNKNVSKVLYIYIFDLNIFIVTNINNIN